MNVSEGGWVRNDSVGDERVVCLHHSQVRRVVLFVGAIDTSSPKPLEHLKHGVSFPTDFTGLDGG